MNVNTYSPIFKYIKKEDYRIDSFRVHKEYSLTSGSKYVGLYNTNFSPESYKYRNNLIPFSSSLYTTSSYNGKDTNILQYSIEHILYKTFSEDDYNKSEYHFNLKRYLFESSSIISISNQIYGEGIKPNSVNINGYIIDDGKGNLIDTQYNTSSFINKDNQILSLKFNEKYQYKNKPKLLGLVYDYSNHNHNITINGSIGLEDGVSNISGSIGYGITFNGVDSYLYCRNSDIYKFKPNEDFGISLYTKVPVEQEDTTTEYNVLLSKRREGIVEGFDKNKKGITRVVKDLNRSQYPFELVIYNQSSGNDGKVGFKRSDGINTINLISTSTINDGQYHSVVVTKSGSFYNLYIDGVNEHSSSFNNFQNINNECDIYIGSNGLRHYISCSLDNINIYKNTTISDEQVKDYNSTDYTSGSYYQDNRIGNILYNNGLLIISDPRPKYKNINDNITIDIKNTQIIYEHTCQVKIRPTEMNMTLNPSLRVDGDLESEQLRGFVTGSSFTPYITTIGLYNEFNELVAIGKLSSPVPKRNDVPLNFIIKFDT